MDAKQLLIIKIDFLKQLISEGLVKLNKCTTEQETAVLEALSGFPDKLQYCCNKVVEMYDKMNELSPDSIGEHRWKAGELNHIKQVHSTLLRWLNLIKQFSQALRKDKHAKRKKNVKLRN